MSLSTFASAASGFALVVGALAPLPAQAQNPLDKVLSGSDSFTVRDAMDYRTHPLTNPTVSLPFARDLMPQRLVQVLAPYKFPTDIVESAGVRTANTVVKDLFVKPDTAVNPTLSSNRFTLAGKTSDPLKQDFGTYILTYGVAPDATGAFKPYRAAPVVCIQAKDNGQLKIVDVFQVVSDKLIYEGTPKQGEIFYGADRSDVVPPTLRTMPTERWQPLMQQVSAPSGEPCKDLLKTVADNVLRQREAQQAKAPATPTRSPS